MRDIPLVETVLPDGRSLFTGTMKMRVPTGATARVAQIELPQLVPDPVATFSVVSNEGNGAVFQIYSVKFGYTKSTTTVSVDAFGPTSDDDFFWSYMVVGQKADDRTQKAKL